MANDGRDGGRDSSPVARGRRPLARSGRAETSMCGGFRTNLDRASCVHNIRHLALDVCAVRGGRIFHGRVRSVGHMWSVGRTRVRPTALLSIDDDDDDPRGWRERRSYARARVYMAIAVVRDVAVVRVVRSMRPRSTRASA